MEKKAPPSKASVAEVKAKVLPSAATPKLWQELTEQERQAIIEKKANTANAMMAENIQKRAEARARDVELKANADRAALAKKRQEELEDRRAPAVQQFVEDKIVQLGWLRVNAPKRVGGPYTPKVLRVLPAAIFGQRVEELRSLARNTAGGDGAKLRQDAEDLYRTCCVHWDDERRLRIRRLCGLYESPHFHAKPLQVNQLVGCATLRAHFRDHYVVDVAAHCTAFPNERKQHVRPGSTATEAPLASTFRNWEPLLACWHTEAHAQCAAREAQERKGAHKKKPKPAMSVSSSGLTEGNLFAVLTHQDE